ncbi:hypothetical protein L202_02824 [Cryptococcus amylolentus CBS 6039]|uniref:Uncharacterized protein n=1 Tax=Cryptococcus amylolentus CBS 6039 TaxID=1295533 RepID=A0A1E3HWE2_9TREE|nr:hypothetical protein L202_02824 [Cryptococcus amylolentus CBS 6039]ODN80643.1 hypothetical protein L202_02824 [Cryptococcus amylolentus CBS 6039]
MPQSSRHTTSVNGSSGSRNTHTNTQQSRFQRSQTDPTFQASGRTTLDSCFRRSRRSNTTGSVKQFVRFSDFDRVHYFWPLDAVSRRIDDDTTTRNEQPTTEDWRNLIQDPAASYDDVGARPEPKERRNTTSASSGPSYRDTYEIDGFDMMAMTTEEALKEIIPSIAEPWVKLITTVLSISSDDKHAGRRKDGHRESGKSHSDRSRRRRSDSGRSGHHDDERVNGGKRGSSSKDVSHFDRDDHEWDDPEHSRHRRRENRHRSESPPVTWGEVLDRMDSSGSARRARQGVTLSQDERDRDDQRHDARRARPAHRGRDETTPSSPDDRASTSSRQPLTQHAPSPYAPPPSGDSSRRGSASQRASPPGAGSPRCTEASRTVTEKRTSAYPIETVDRDGSLRVEHVTVSSAPVQINEYYYRDPRHSSDDIIRVERETSDVDANSQYAPSSRYTPTKGQPGYVSPERQDVERERLYAPSSRYTPTKGQPGYVSPERQDVERERLSITIRDQPRQASERTSPPGQSQRRSEYGVERPDNSGRAGADRPQGKGADSSYFPSDQSYTNGNHSPREHAQRSEGRFSPGRYEDAPRQGSSHSTRTPLSPIKGVKYVQGLHSHPPMDRRRSHTRESELNWGRKEQNSSIDGRRPSFAKNAISASPQSYSPTSTMPSSPSRMNHDYPMSDQRTSHGESSSASRAYRPQRPSLGQGSLRPMVIEVEGSPKWRARHSRISSQSSRVSEQKPTHSRENGKKSSKKPAYDDPYSDVESTAGVSGGKGRTGMDENERRRLEHRRMSMFQNDVEVAEKPRR